MERKKPLYETLSQKSEVEIVVEHRENVGPPEVRKLRKVGERARMYHGSETKGLLSSNEAALVYPGEDHFFGTPKDYFKPLADSDGSS